MQELDWRDEYLIDVALVDKEHKALFAIAEEAFHVLDPSHRAER